MLFCTTKYSTMTILLECPVHYHTIRYNILPFVSYTLEHNGETACVWRPQTFTDDAQCFYQTHVTSITTVLLVTPPS